MINNKTNDTVAITLDNNMLSINPEITKQIIKTNNGFQTMEHQCFNCLTIVKPIILPQKYISKETDTKDATTCPITIALGEIGAQTQRATICNPVRKKAKFLYMFDWP